MLTAGIEYDYVTRTSLNQGVLQTTGFVNHENINHAGTWSLGLLQMDFFYRNKPWYAGQFVRKIVPKMEIPQGAILYFSTVLNKQKPILLSVLVRNVDKTFENITVDLPTTNNHQIDFAFMGDFIAQLQAMRVAELEAMRAAELSAYLKVSAIDNYELSAKERKTLNNLKNIQWGEYRMGTLFEKIKTKKLPYKAKELPKEATGKYVLPCLTSSFKNQGLNYFAPKEGATVLSNVITIPQNSDVYRAYFQTADFTVLSDAYAIVWKYDKRKISRNQYLFMVMCINKVTDLPIYSYKNKLGGWNIVKDKYILLPQSNGEINFDFMETFISAMQKLAIKDVVQYADHRISAAQKAIETRNKADKSASVP